MIATRVTADGNREVRGVDVGDSEGELFWTGFLRSMKNRGLDGVKLVISDAHAGLKAAIARVLQGTAWQRCRVHLMRNLLTTVPKGQAEMDGDPHRRPSAHCSCTASIGSADWFAVSDAPGVAPL